MKQRNLPQMPLYNENRINLPPLSGYSENRMKNEKN